MSFNSGAVWSILVKGLADLWVIADLHPQKGESTKGSKTQSVPHYEANSLNHTNGMWVSTLFGVRWGTTGICHVGNVF